MKNLLLTICRALALSLVLLCAALPSWADPTGPDGPAVMSGFVLQRGEGPSTGLLETAEQLASFLDHLPPDVPSMKQPAPSNPDPLRRGLKLDFSKDVVVVAVHRDTISAFPVFHSFSESVAERVVHFDVPERPPEARPQGWGVYTLVVLPKVEVPTLVRLQSVPSDDW